MGSDDRSGLHHVPIQHSECQRFPEPDVGVHGCSVPPAPEGARLPARGLAVGAQRSARPQQPPGAEGRRLQRNEGRILGSWLGAGSAPSQPIAA